MASTLNTPLGDPHIRAKLIQLLGRDATQLSYVSKETNKHLLGHQPEPVFVRIKGADFVSKALGAFEAGNGVELFDPDVNDVERLLDETAQLGGTFRLRLVYKGARVGPIQELLERRNPRNVEIHQQWTVTFMCKKLYTGTKGLHLTHWPLKIYASAFTPLVLEAFRIDKANISSEEENVPLATFNPAQVKLLRLGFGGYGAGKDEVSEILEHFTAVETLEMRGGSLHVVCLVPLTQLRRLYAPDLRGSRAEFEQFRRMPLTCLKAGFSKDQFKGELQQFLPPTLENLALLMHGCQRLWFDDEARFPELRKLVVWGLKGEIGVQQRDSFAYKFRGTLVHLEGTNALPKLAFFYLQYAALKIVDSFKFSSQLSHLGLDQVCLPEKENYKLPVTNFKRLTKIKFNGVSPPLDYRNFPPGSFITPFTGTIRQTDTIVYFERASYKRLEERFFQREFKGEIQRSVFRTHPEQKLYLNGN